jgi:hypothetical protein
LGIGCAAEQSQPGQSTAAASKFSQDDEIEARFQRIIGNYGDRLSEKQRNQLRKIVAYNERLLKLIRLHLNAGRKTGECAKPDCDGERRRRSGKAVTQCRHHSGKRLQSQRKIEYASKHNPQ